MLLRKMLIVGVATVAIMHVSAASADTQNVPAPIASPATIGYYFEGQVGYAAQDYFSDPAWSTHSGVTSNNGNVRGGFAGGIDAGYALGRHAAVELGWLYLPSVNVAGVDSNGSVLSPVNLTSWVVYLAAKYSVLIPRINNTDWFFKLGAAYRRAQVSDTAAVNVNGALPITTGSANFIRPMFATGFRYNFAGVWMAVLQYAYFMGSGSQFPYSASAIPQASGAMGVEDANVVTVGMGYKFVL